MFIAEGCNTFANGEGFRSLMQIHVPVNQAFVRDEDWQAQGEVCIQPQIQDKAMGVDGDLSVILPEVLKSMAQIK